MKVKDDVFVLVKDLVQTFGTAEAALKAVQRTPIPRKRRNVKKQLAKWLRTYIYCIRTYSGGIKNEN